jgi:hypothetical protein
MNWSFTKNQKTMSEFEDISDSDLIKATRDYRNTTFEDDHILRVIASRIFNKPIDKTNVVDIMHTAPFVALELARRLHEYSSRLDIRGCEVHSGRIC